MTKHLKSFHKPMSLEEYNEKFNENVKAVSQFWFEQNKGHTFKSGKDNPAYQHGGKFSPFSKKFIHADKVDIEAIKEKAVQSKRDHPENNTTRIEYWIKFTDGDVEKAKQLLAERQITFSLEKCIKKYGKEKGLERWRERQEKWIKSLCSKSDEEKTRIVKLKTTSGNSTLEDTIYQNLCDEFGKNNIERQFVLIQNKNTWTYDFLLYNKIIIEVNGDYWHMNPEIYQEDNFNKNKQKTAKEIWEYDDKKIQDACSYGYKAVTLWESDYNKNGITPTITKIKELLNESR